MEAVAATRFDSDAEGEVRIGIGGHNLVEALKNLINDSHRVAFEGAQGLTFAARGVISMFISLPSSSLRGFCMTFWTVEVEEKEWRKGFKKPT